MRGTWPCSSSVVRRRPHSSTSSAPNVLMPTVLTQTGRWVRALMAAIFSGQSSASQWFQSMGKPYNAAASRWSSAPWPCMTRMTSGPVKLMPPSTRGNPGASAAIACPVRAVIGPNMDQPGSFSKSRCDLLFGSVPIMAASIIGQLQLRGRRSHTGRRASGCVPRRQMNTSSSGMSVMVNPAARSMAALLARLGAHPLVLSWLWLCSWTRSSASTA